MGQDTLDFGTSFSSVSRRKVCQAGVSFPFEPTEGGQSSVRYAHFVLASFQKILNSFNPVLPRILIFLRGVRCLFRFPLLGWNMLDTLHKPSNNKWLYSKESSP